LHNPISITDYAYGLTRHATATIPFVPAASALDKAENTTPIDYVNSKGCLDFTANNGAFGQSVELRANKEP
jgi:hypothetical protein